jgi:Xaa-Pro aminopeptidase
MFTKDVYIKRRELLRKEVGSGLILISGNDEAPMNYPANPYPYRQDSNFLYFFGLDKPGFMGVLDVDEGKDYIFGEDFTIDDIIWMGPQPKVQELAALVGVEHTGTLGRLQEMIDGVVGSGKRVHFLPPYRAENLLKLSRLTGVSHSRVKDFASVDLIKAVVAQRALKSDDEVKEIEKALDISYLMVDAVLKNIEPGLYERELVGKMEGVVGDFGSFRSFPIILSIHGETLHNHYHGNQMKKGDLLVADSGAESPLYYASDITRTFPVSGTFSPKQKAIYEVVLKSQLTAIEESKPGVLNRDVHLKTAEVIAEGLIAEGLMKGNPKAAVEAGAHALFFPHGLGHMMGLDVHDMEDLGENYVGYDEETKRASQFGLAYLRMGRRLKTGYVLTVEPGVYFIPALIDQWKAEGKHSQFINYDKVEEYKDFGGIRIEDDILITGDGCRVLGKPIPKTVDEIESAIG